ncbi:H(+)/Cl(-) exchange transporter [Lachnellula subtilissima]|uniref:H(+)/Cl(-) exchange transporter n=1 Tax=Lachnellula subtilissima TaxID=602034 RepID=A0A8H8S0S8_9HELO|nr:H(+)/Cl(-) exchange transporter [Lachnellula subtilissima]
MVNVREDCLAWKFWSDNYRGNFGIYVGSALLFGIIAGAVTMTTRANLPTAKQHDQDQDSEGDLGLPIDKSTYMEISTYLPRKVLWRAFLCYLSAAVVLKALNPNGTGKLVPFETKYGVSYLPNTIYFSSSSVYTNPVLELALVVLITVLLQHPNPPTREPGDVIIKNLLVDGRNPEASWLSQLKARGLMDAGLVLVDGDEMLHVYLAEGELDFAIYEDGVLKDDEPVDLLQGPLSAFVDRTPLSICAKAPMEYAVEMFGKLGLRYLVVVDEGTAKVVGVIIKKRLVLHTATTTTTSPSQLLSTLLCAEPTFEFLKGELFVESSDCAEEVLLAPSPPELVDAGAIFVVTVEVLKPLLLAMPEVGETDDDKAELADADIKLVDSEPESVLVLSIVIGNTSVNVDPPCAVVIVAVDTEYSIYSDDPGVVATAALPLVSLPIVTVVVT